MADKLTTTPLTLPVWPDLANPKVPTNLVTFWTVLKNVDFKTKLLWLYFWNKFGHFLFWHYTSPKLTFNFYNFLIELAPGLKFSLSFRVNSNSICQREDPGTKRKFSTKKLKIVKKSVESSDGFQSNLGFTQSVISPLNTKQHDSFFLLLVNSPSCLIVKIQHV